MRAARLIAAGLCVALGGCPKGVVVVPPNLQPASDSLRRPCPVPVAVPYRVLTQAETEALWIKDRKNLRTCHGRHSALVHYYDVRDGLLAGTK